MEQMAKSKNFKPESFLSRYYEVSKERKTISDPFGKLTRYMNFMSCKKCFWPETNY